MYLFSLYFDEKTNRKIKTMIHNVAEKSGNRYMVEHNVPPHITISAFEASEVKHHVEMLNEVLSNRLVGEIQWISFGVFV